MEAQPGVTTLTKGISPAGKNKCNKFVSDVLISAKVPVPVMNGVMSPPTAGQWADPNYVIPHFPVVTEPMPGDIVAEAHNYADATGHVGIVVGTNLTASQSSNTDTVVVNDWGFRPDNNPTFRRWTPEPFSLIPADLNDPSCTCQN